MRILSMLSYAALAAFAIPLFADGNGSPAPPPSSAPFLGRGINVSAAISDQNLADFAATGGTLVRIAFALRPLRDLDPPYAMNQENLALLDHLLDQCEKLKLRAVIDPHRFPGMTDKFTTHAFDPLWSDASFQDLAVDLWTQIARREAHRGDVIAGYDLLNEPSLPNMGRRGTLADWNAFAARMSAAIRAVDTTHTIIIESPVLIRGDRGASVEDRSETFGDYLAASSDPNTVYSLHMYKPWNLTMQGQGGRPTGVDYPGNVDGQQWNASAIAQYFKPVANFQQRHHVQIFVGEFSATRWSGDGGTRYVKDVIDYCEAHQWSWAFHEWRGADAWDAEKSEQPNDMQRHPTTPRLQMLEGYWKQGN